LRSKPTSVSKDLRWAPPIRFRAAAFGNLWNQLQPERHPRIIAQSTDDQDVSAAVKFPREHVENRSP
jgi:hypothetical protein